MVTEENPDEKILRLLRHIACRPVAEDLDGLGIEPDPDMVADLEVRIGEFTREALRRGRHDGDAEPARTEET